MNQTELSNFLDEVLDELQYRIEEGLINLNNPTHKSILSEILHEQNMGHLLNPIVDAALLTEADPKTKDKPSNPSDDDYSHLGNGIYVKKGNEDKPTAPKFKKDDQGNYKAMSSAEAGDIKQKAGEDGGSNNNPQAKTDDGSKPADAQGAGGNGGEQAEAPPVNIFDDPEYQKRVKELDDVADGTSEEQPKNGLFNVGGDYWSSTPNGKAEFKRVTEIWKPITEAITTTDQKGNTIKVEPLKSVNDCTETELDKIDNDITDSQLYMTTAQAKEQAAQSGNKNVGAGTAESRAGEALVHKGLRELASGKSIEEIQDVFKTLVNSPDHILNSKEGKKWVESAIASISMIGDTYGVQNIKSIAWDTEHGRKLVGVSKDLHTSSDMFIKLNDGKTVGISLKKNGIVFIKNGGWAKAAEEILADLKPSLSDTEYNDIEKAMGIESYKKDLSERFAETTKTITADMLKQDLMKLQSLSPVEYNKLFGGTAGPKYIKVLENAEKLLKTIKANPDGMNIVEMKAYSKILQMYHKAEYNHLNDADKALTSRTFDALNKTADTKDAINKFIIESMHIADTLGLNKTLKQGGVDEFATIYGIPPDGAILDEHELITLFGGDFKTLLTDVRNGDKQPEEITKFISNTITIDYKEGDAKGTIYFKHADNKIFPLFVMTGRSRGIGSSPTMELSQTPFMAHALKQGSFDTETWSSKAVAKFKEDILGSD